MDRGSGLSLVIGLKMQLVTTRNIKVYTYIGFHMKYFKMYKDAKYFDFSIIYMRVC